MANDQSHWNPVQENLISRLHWVVSPRHAGGFHTDAFEGQKQKANKIGCALAVARKGAPQESIHIQALNLINLLLWQRCIEAVLLVVLLGIL